MAKKHDSATRQMAMVDIAKHLKEHGDVNWSAVREKYRDVPSSTFHRWVKTVRDSLRGDNGELTAAASIALEASDHIPAAPSPDYIAKSGQAGRAQIDFMARLDQLYSDAELLREFGMRDGKIVSPKYFAQSVMLRKGLLETALKAMSEVWDLRQMQAFYDAVIEAVAEESPETAQRIMDKLKGLNSETGMTYEMARV